MNFRQALGFVALVPDATRPLRECGQSRVWRNRSEALKHLLRAG